MATFGKGVSYYSSGYFYGFTGTVVTVPSGMYYAKVIVQCAANAGASTMNIGGSLVYTFASGGATNYNDEIIVPAGSTLALSVGGGQPTVGISWVIFTNT